MSGEQTDNPFPKQKDLSHLISHLFPQNIQEFLGPQACCRIWLKLNSELRSRLGEEKDTQACVTSVGDLRASNGRSKAMCAGLGTRASVQYMGLAELGSK